MNNLVVESTPFANLAIRISRGVSTQGEIKQVLIENASEIFNKVNETIIDELVQAGFPRKIERKSGRPEQGPYQMFKDVESIRMNNGHFPEIPTNVVGFYNGWKFGFCFGLNSAWSEDRGEV